MSEIDNYQPEQPAPYEPPAAQINYDRNVAGEEQHNNYLAVNTAMKDLIIATHYEQRTGTPQRYLMDDLDNDRMIEIPMDAQWKQMVLYGIGRERQYLEKQGIIFDFRSGGGESHE